MLIRRCIAFTIGALISVSLGIGQAAPPDASQVQAPSMEWPQLAQLRQSLSGLSQAIQSNMRSVTAAQRKAAAVRAKARRATAAKTVRAVPVPGGTPDYFGIYPNYANSPFPIVMPDGSVQGGVRKFIDTLPGLDSANQNNLGQYIPIAKPDTLTFPGSDYYEISLVEYSQKLHTDLPVTKLRGYVQTNNGTNPITHQNTLLPAPVRYMGPLIIAQKDRPVRVKFTNALPTGLGGNLFLPVDTTLMGAGTGPFGNSPPFGPANYTQNRASVHLHGGNTPWISDGTPYQWITPAGEVTAYPKGVSQRNVPDMFFDPITHQPVPANTPGATNDPGPGSETLFYTNQQSARLMFYHDHAHAITRLNVYAGEAAPYILRDPTEQALITAGTIPAAETPLVVQDKTFVSLRIGSQDPTWDTVKWGPKGNLWFPHVYMPNQNPYDDSGTNAMGRWDYGPWFWPPYTGLTHGPVPNPYYGQPGEPPVIPGTPDPSCVPEAFMDTPIVNGTAYPTYTIQPKAYRFRILNACNDRFLNLQLYFADNGGGGSGATATAGITNGVVTTLTLTNGGHGYVSAPGVYMAGGTECATAIATVAGGAVTSLTLTCGGSGFTTAPLVFIGDLGEVKMVPAVPHPCNDLNWPATWPTDGRDGGVPDPMSSGPVMIQIGSEGGFLPAPAIVPPQPINYNYNRRDIVVLNVENHSLFLGPAERADVIVDFSGCTSGSTLIMYNDAPAPVPAFDTRNDYYTCDPDQTDTGGAPTTLPGHGPNTRTVMQIKVSGTPAAPFNLNALNAALPQAFKTSQPVPPVPEMAYGSNVNTYVRIQDTQLTYIIPGTGTVTTKQLGPKAIQELFDPDYGRMNSTLGVELPNTNVNIQTTIPYFYIDPPTEFLQDGQTAIWKVTHNGVDTHAIHFHLFNVQLLNRVGWDGAIRPPDPNELGWKETVRMNPLEDAIVAMTPVKQNLPFTIGDSIRLLNPTAPQGSTQGFTDIDPNTGNPITVTNQYTNFGNEYVWHCHLLGHEENDMMRPVVFQVAPGAPAGVVVTQTGLRQVSVAFAAGPNGGSPITLFTATSNPGSISASATTSPITISNLTQGIPYTFTVTATNAIGTSPASAPSNSITLPTAAPAAPSNLVATPSVLSTNPPSILLTWTRNSTNESGFTIQRAPTSGFGNVTTFNVGPGVTTFTDTTVAQNTRYYYRVQAFNFVGNSAFSNTANALTPGQLPLAPTNLAVGGVTRTSITLNWTDNANNETGFYLNRSTAGPTGPWTRLTMSGSTTPPPSTVVRTATSLTPNRTYWFQVQAFNSYGTSTLSNTVSATTLP